MSGTTASILETIGGTPLVELSRRSSRGDLRLFGKLEWFNPGGSVKDRPARQMILDGLAGGGLRRGMEVIEASSGNTGTGLALVCRVLGFDLTLVVPEVTSQDKLRDLQRLGARVDILPGATTEAPLAEVYRRAEAEPERYFHTDQYSNPSNPRAHQLSTGPEILADCPDVTHVVAAQGSFGTLGGLGYFFREHKPDVKLYSVVAKPGEDTIYGMKESHKTTSLVDDSVLAGRFLATGQDSLAGIQRGLSQGLHLGPSAGAVLSSAERLADRLADGRIVCIFADSGTKYSACALYEPSQVSTWSTAELNDAHFTNW